MRLQNIFFILIIMINISFAQDQIKRNVYSLGGTIYYYSSTEKIGSTKNDQTSIVIEPSLSYFIIDQFEVSLYCEYLHETFNETDPMYIDSYEMKDIQLGLGLGIRYYFPLDKYIPFIGISGVSRWYSSQSQTYSTPKMNGTLIGGIEIFISNSAAIEPTVSYTTYGFDENDTGGNIKVGIGMKYYILKSN
jgi:hypothetical protein